MECPSCRAEVPEGGKFCIECGAPLPHACPACGHVISGTAKFCPECGADLGPARAAAFLSPAPAPPMPSAPLLSAERRHLTVMFCDLVGSTALASNLDLEELREVIAAYHKCAAETVGRFDGFVAKYMGDGVLA
jgi:RNA polymerase subunit RPABC4/transcription elongation factor Spt4